MAHVMPYFTDNMDGDTGGDIRSAAQEEKQMIHVKKNEI